MADHCIRAGATGTGTGADWTNAYTDFGTGAGQINPASMVRGDTYWIATGTYSPAVFTSAESGTSVITVQRATIATHGPTTGWNNAFDGQVTISFDNTNHWNWIIKTGYWTFDGVTGDGQSTSTASYGFLFAQPTSCATPQEQYLFLGNPANVAVSNVNIKHFAINSCGASFDVQQTPIFIGCGGCGTVSSSTFSYFLVENGQQLISFENTNGITIEHAYIGPNWSSGTHHGNTISVSIASTDSTDANLNSIIRYNVLKGTIGSGTIFANNSAGASPGKVCVDGWQIYGNLVDTPNGGNGVFSSSSNCVYANTLIYNNTIVNGASFFWWACNTPDPNSVCASSTGNVLKDNLLWSQAADIVINTAPSPTHDYNAYESCTGTIPTEANGQIGTSDLFISSGTGDYRLATDTNAWDANVGGPPGNTIDYYGNIRTSSRGFQQFNGSGPASGFPAPSTNTSHHKRHLKVTGY